MDIELCSKEMEWTKATYNNMDESLKERWVKTPSPRRLLKELYHFYNAQEEVNCILLKQIMCVSDRTVFTKSNGIVDITWRIVCAPGEEARSWSSVQT